MPRSTASCTITFGLVAVPVKVFTAASGEDVHMHHINPATGSRVNSILVDAVSRETMDRAALVLGYEVTPGSYVTFTKDELKGLEPTTSKTVDLVAFVPASSIDPVSVEQSYYLGPDKGGDRGYALLSETMAARGVAGVGQWSNRGKEKLVTIQPYRGGLRLDLMYYATEVRSFDEVLGTAAKVAISDAERALAAQLVGHLAADAFDASAYYDTYAERVRQAAAQKASGQGVTVSPEAPRAIIIDLCEAMRRSMPAANAEPVPAASPGPAKTTLPVEAAPAGFALEQAAAPRARKRRAS